MGRRTDPQILVDHLRGQPNNSASPERLSAITGWPADKVARAIQRGVKDPYLALHIGRGGTVQFRGEEASAQPGIYNDVARIITSYWGPRELGLRNTTVAFSARGGTRGWGTWTHPDLVVSADPRRRRSQSEPPRLHAIEVEAAEGFGLKSVYQAHAQGRGANYCWVIGAFAPGITDYEWDRVLWTAKELGVGIVEFDRPGAYGTWHTHLHAEFKTPSQKLRQHFIDITLRDDQRIELGVT